MDKAIYYLEHHLINKAQWDKTIAASFNGIVYAYSWYLDIVSPNWDALVVGNYEMVMPITHKKRFTISYLCQPAFTQQLGVFSNQLLGSNEVDFILETIPDDYKLIEINLNTNNKTNSEEFSKKENITCHLPLIQSYQKIVEQYSEQINRNIKKAQKNELEVSWKTSLPDVINLFKNNRGKDIETLQAEQYTQLEHIMEYAILHGLGFALGVKNKSGILMAGAFFIQSNGKIIFLFSGTNQEAKTTGAMSLLIDEMIMKNAGRNLILDFEGSNNQQLARFYKGFGAQEIHYLSIKKNNLPAIIKWLK